MSENHFFSCKERYLVRPNPIGIKVKKIRTTNYLFIQVNAVHLTCFISSINCFVCLISRFVTSFLTKSGPGRETLGSAMLKSSTSAGSLTNLERSAILYYPCNSLLFNLNLLRVSIQIFLNRGMSTRIVCDCILYHAFIITYIITRAIILTSIIF